MTAALFVAALAVLCAPTPSARRRLGPPAAGAAAVGVTPVAVVVAAVAVVVGAVVVAPTAGVAAAMIVGTVAHRVRRAHRDRLRDGEIRALLAGLDVAVADLRVGAHPESACLAAAAEASGRPAEAFRSAAATARLGGSAAHGLLTGSRRDDGDGGTVAADLDRIAVAWRIAERHGIPLAELLDAARVDLVGRRRFRSRVESGMAGARATAAVLACLPVLGVALGQMMGAGPIRVLLSGGLGGVLLVVGTALACAGLAWADRITRRVTA